MGIYDAWEKGRQSARDQQTRSGLAKFLQGDQSALPQVYANNPQEAMAAQTFMGQQQDAAEDRFGKLSGIYAQTKDPSVYQQIRPLAKQLLGADLPESLDDPADLDGSLKAATAWAQAYGGAQQQDSTPAAIRELQMLQANPELAALDMKRRTAGFNRPHLQIDQQGRPWFLSPDSPPIPAYSAPPQSDLGAATVMDGAYRDAQVDPVADFSTLAEKYPSVQVSSLARSPERNAKVGGVANSYHVKGQGGDFVVPMAQRQQFMAEARQMGYDAIDEGDHVHLEPRRGAHASSSFAPGQGIGQGGPRFGKAPDQSKQPARQMTPQEVAAAGLAPGTVAYMGESGVPNVVQRPASGGAGGGKPMPVGALKEVLAIEDAIGASVQMAQTLNRHAKRMVSGELVVRPENAIGARIRTATGFATQNDVNLTEFKADITRTVNEWLRLNKGVQTEGDAQREYKAIMDSNDPKTAASAVARLARIIENTVQIQRRKRDTINRNYGNAPQRQSGGSAPDPLGIL